MDDLDDELDLLYHKGVEPDVYYRCPTLESLDGALRNEIEKNAATLIPTEIVTEFVFGVTSTITLSVAQQPNLEALIQPADFPQSITVEIALCRDIDEKCRLKTQRAISRCFIETIQGIDGFKYSERQVWNKDGGEGTRFKYVCVDSFQNRYRKSNVKQEKAKRENGEEEEEEAEGKKRGKGALATYDCGGAIHVRFSTKRDAVNVVYKHNLIHRDVESRPATEESGDSELPTMPTEKEIGTSNGKPNKRKRSKKNGVESDNGLNDLDLDTSTSSKPANKTTPKNKTKKNATPSPPEATQGSAKKKNKGKQAQSPSNSQLEASVHDPTPLPPPPPKLAKGKACLRCREKRIKCNEAKPTCNQCQRGLWVCQYKTVAPRKRSKNGCINCRQRKRKCTEEHPSCAYCLKVDDDCEYVEEHE
ncbi:hypothetical protein K504DRAFT_445656 [Pleomassaria siparia CBS 279.74]|uniref:Zn(2)-C6 fungal-type domain-containing protein n=1 Tax=Pleomassaria siparia CBS 279.74 TaxID=1314801 RepID=A0A6G1KPB6_9PLEO|nr:hypothetical protein K504DRAFT_445656 [Pleomassaria siparia CBS 279.74]